MVSGSPRLAIVALIRRILLDTALSIPRAGIDGRKSVEAKICACRTEKGRSPLASRLARLCGPRSGPRLPGNAASPHRHCLARSECSSCPLDLLLSSRAASPLDFSRSAAYTYPPTMPHVRIPGDVSVYYEFHTASGAHDATKPSLLLIAPSWTNATFLGPYVEAFKRDFSVCCVELRGHGRTRGGVRPTYDYFCGAADLAFTMEALNLPPSHVFGAGGEAFAAALKLAVLFPRQVLSLSLVGATGLFQPPRNIKAFEEVDEQWSNPDDEEVWQNECMGAVGQFLLTKEEGFEEAWDAVLSAVVRLYNPYKPEYIWMSSTPNHRHPRLTPDTLAKLRQPILILQGEQDLCFPVEDVADTVKHFTGSQGLQFHTVPDGPHLLAITHAPSVINMMQAFLLKHVRPPTSAIPFDFRSALQSASSIAGNPDIAHRDPRAPDAFSLLDQEEYEAGAKRFENMKRRGDKCKLDLPMCFEKNDWEEGAAQQRRWTCVYSPFAARSPRC
ncbi:Alpha/Beta hydrolase protein [Rhodotorula toruloides]